jgi:hypothetical protein
MPALEDIRKFNTRLVSLGDEPAVVSEWGEELEDVPEPDEGMDEDLSSLLSEEGPPDDQGAPSFEELLNEEADSPVDFDDTFAVDEPEGEDPAAVDDPFGADTSALMEGLSDDEFALPDEFADLDAPELDEADAQDEFAMPDDEPVAEELPPEDEEPAAEDDAAEDDAAGLDEFGDLDDDLFGTEESVDPPEAPAEQAEPAEELENGFDLSDDEEFDLPDGGFSLDDEESGSGGEDEFGGFDLSDDEEFTFEAPPVVPGDESEGPAAAPSADEDEFDEDDLDEFSLGDFGAEFGVLDDGGPSEEDLNPAINVPDVAAAAPSQGRAPGDFRLGDQEFDALKSTLATLPLNLKLETERIVAESDGTTEQVEKLCRMLVDGKSPADIAAYVGKITGKQIRIPRGYEKQTGVAFEQERNSFAYQFRENIWPVLRLVGIALILITGLGIAGYNFVYRPLYARSLYTDGLEFIENDQYTLGNQTFGRAWAVWPDTRWYYEYAEAFIDERQYTLAQQKYEELLFGRTPEEREAANNALAAGNYEAIVRVREPEKQGILDYAALESEILGNYPRAEQLLQLILFDDVTDYEARLALGDNYMNWAAEEPARYEQARLAYARLMERFGQTDELLFRMLRYFIRTDNLEQALVLKEAFQNDPRAEIDPQIYAELAGYLIDQNQLADVEDVLFRVLDIDNTIPEVHYQLARYYREIQAVGEEQLALNTARTLLSELQPLPSRERGMLIDTHTRIGENQYAVGAYLDAQESFTEAITLFEEGLRRRVLEPTPVYARAYSRLGDIFYYVGREFRQALAQFDSAEQYGYDTPDQDYRQGFVHYRLGELEDALDEFREAEADPAALTNALLWALANTHHRRENYFAAQAFYGELLDRVEFQRDRIRTLLLDEDPTHRSVIEYLYKGYNNLGVALYRLSQQNPTDAQFYSDGLVALTRSTELAENYQRDPDTLARTEGVDLAFLNQREALFPTPQFEMQIYNDIPEDLDDLLF